MIVLSNEKNRLSIIKCKWSIYMYKTEVYHASEVWISTCKGLMTYLVQNLISKSTCSKICK